MRRRQHSAEPAPLHEAIAAPGAAERIAGFRIVRRLADGDRAALYLVADDESSTELDSTNGRVGAGPDPGAGPGSAPARLAILRLYEPTADQRALATEIEAMSRVGAVPRLIDLAVLPDGRTCVFVERIGGPSLARLLIDAVFSPGEAVTLLAPIVVAVGEFERHGLAHTRLSPADVVLDEQGRARIIGTGALVGVVDHGGDGRAWTDSVKRMHEALADLIDAVARSTSPAGALAPVASLLSERLDARPFRSSTAEVERALFALAQPLPVRAAIPSISPGRDVRWESGARDDRAPRATAVDSSPQDAASRPRGSGLVRLLAQLIGAGEAAAVPGELVATARGTAAAGAAATPSGVRARIGAALARRRSTLIVGGLIGGGALVLMLTFVPPGDAGSAARSQAGSGAAQTVGSALPAPRSGADDAATLPGGDGTEASAPSANEADAAPGKAASAPVAPPSGDDDPMAETARLLAARAGCLEQLDLACLDDIVDPGSAQASADRVAVAAGQQGAAPEQRPAYDFEHARLVGTMGAAFLVEVPYSGAEREPASVLVMRTEAGWRVREIFD